MEVAEILTEEEQEVRQIKRAYKSLLKRIRVKRTRKETLLIKKAYEKAVEAHRPQRRKSGEAYIFHPIAVAKICAEEIGLGVTSVIAALLHDTVEDTEMTSDDIEQLFGAEIRKIVEGLTKLDDIFDVESPQAENFKKILSTLADDPRVVLIKMADRLHNMRTISAMSHNSQLKIASETEFIYAPLAHRLGLYNLKTEFEDLCMQVLEAETYKKVSDELERTKKGRDKFIKTFLAPVTEELDKYEDLKGKYRAFGRVKAISSIAAKMKKKKVEVEDIYDIFAVRIILDVPIEKERQVCWQVYSILTDMYMPIPDRLKDWTREAKANGYQSLHTTVVIPFDQNKGIHKKERGKYVEVQIRSERMNDVAEKGLAAHWAYKGNSTEKVFDKWLNTVRDLLENPAVDAIDFLRDFKANLFVKEVYVFTHKGEMKMLQKGATALDFAFAIHTELGYHCTSVKVNNILVPLSYVLRNGDKVLVNSSNNQKPSRDWLDIVVTSKAKSRIKAALREEERKRAEYGKEIVMRKFKSLRINYMDSNIDFLVKHFKLKNRTELFSEIDQEHINIQRELKKFAVENGRLMEFKELIFDAKGDEENVIPEKYIDKKGVAPKLLIGGEDASQYVYELATCCTPVQGDNIFAYTTATGIMKIHRVTCPNATNLLANYGYRVMSAEWVQMKNTNYIVDLRLIGVDSKGLVQKITTVITNQLNFNMRSIKMEGGEGFFTGEISVVVANTDQLHLLIKTLKEIPNVSSVNRIEP